MKFLALFVAFLLAAPAMAQDEPAATATPVRLDAPLLQGELRLIIGNVQRPNGIVWHDGALFTVCNGDWTIYKIDADTQETVTFVFGVRDGNTLLAEPTEAGFDLFIPDAESGALWRVDQKREAPDSLIADLEAPWGIARLDESRLLISEIRSNRILEVDHTGSARTAQESLRAPTGIATADERVYFANGGSARRGIEYFEIEDDGGYGPVKPLVAGLQNAADLVLGGDGMLYFSYAFGARGVIGRVDPAMCHEAGCSSQDVEMVVLSDLPAPLAIAMSDDMRLFLHSRYRPEIYWAQLPA